MHYLSREFISDRRHWGRAEQPFYIPVPCLCFMINVLKVLCILPRVHINYRLAKAITLVDPLSQLQAPLHTFLFRGPNIFMLRLGLPAFKKNPNHYWLINLTRSNNTTDVIWYYFSSKLINSNIMSFMLQLKLCFISFNVRNTWFYGIMSALWWTGGLPRVEPRLPSVSWDWPQLSVALQRMSRDT